MMTRTLGLAALTLLLAASPATGALVATFFSLTVSTTAVTIPNAALNPAGQLQINHCSLTLETAQVRYRWDGTAPTAAVGQLLAVGGSIMIESHEDASRIQFIRQGGSDGTIQGHCWRQARRIQ
jgi:hypothetical protein